MAIDKKAGQEICNNIYFSLETQTTTTPTTTYLLGGVNSGGTIGSTKTSIDVTTGYHADKIAGSGNEDGTVGGFYSVDDALNHKMLRDYIDDNVQPFGWVGKQYPVSGGEEIRWTPCLFISCPITGTTDEAITFELTYESTAASIREAVAV